MADPALAHVLLWVGGRALRLLAGWLLPWIVDDVGSMPQHRRQVPHREALVGRGTQRMPVKRG